MPVKKHIPNAITCMNLVCGVVGIIFIFRGQFDFALYAMLCGAVFDFCDGLVARALNAGSAFGKQLDSLSDAITFGLLPGLMFTMYMASCGWSIWACVPMLMPMFAALRLAKFNVDDAQTTGFLGLATPASALLCGCLICFIYGHSDSIIAEWARGNVFLPVLSVILCVLMVSRIPMFSLKITSVTPKRPLIITVIAIIAVAVVMLCLKAPLSIIAVFFIIVYILYNCLASVFRRKGVKS